MSARLWQRGEFHWVVVLCHTLSKAKAKGWDCDDLPNMRLVGYIVSLVVS